MTADILSILLRNINLDQFGIASIMPGLIVARDQLNQLIDFLNQRLNGELRMIPKNLREVIKQPLELQGDSLTPTKRKSHEWTPERRAAASKRLKELHEAQKSVAIKKAKPAPATTLINGKITTNGLAQELGLSNDGILKRAKSLNIEAKQIKNPNPPHTAIRVYTAEQARRIRNHGRKNGAGGLARNHPSNPKHPDHAGWVARAQAARRASVAAKTQGAAA